MSKINYCYILSYKTFKKLNLDERNSGSLKLVVLRGPYMQARNRSLVTSMKDKHLTISPEPRNNSVYVILHRKHFLKCKH